MLDWQGELVDHKHRQKIVLTDVQEDVEIAAASFIGSIEADGISKLLDNQTSMNQEVMPSFREVPPAANEIASVLSHINPTLDEYSLHSRLNERNSLGQFQIAIGSTCSGKDPYLFSNDHPVEVDNGSGDVNQPVGTSDGDIRVPGQENHVVGN